MRAGVNDSSSGTYHFINGKKSGKQKWDEFMEGKNLWLRHSGNAHPTGVFTYLQFRNILDIEDN
jgi:hypothetical protein